MSATARFCSTWKSLWRRCEKQFKYVLKGELASFSGIKHQPLHRGDRKTINDANCFATRSTCSAATWWRTSSRNRRSSSATRNSGWKHNSANVLNAKTSKCSTRKWLPTWMEWDWTRRAADHSRTDSCTSRPSFAWTSPQPVERVWNSGFAVFGDNLKKRNSLPLPLGLPVFNCPGDWCEEKQAMVFGMQKRSGSIWRFFLHMVLRCSFQAGSQMRTLIQCAKELKDQKYSAFALHVWMWIGSLSWLRLTVPNGTSKGECWCESISHTVCQFHFPIQPSIHMLPLQLPFVKRRSPNDLSDGCKTLLNRSCLEPLEARILVWADLVSTTNNY